MFCCKPVSLSCSRSSTPTALCAQGRCLFTLGPLQAGSQLGDLQGAAPTQAYSWGRIGVAPTPGSTRVYDRVTGAMVNCTRDTCPLATPLRQQQPVAGAAAQGHKEGQQPSADAQEDKGRLQPSAQGDNGRQPLSAQGQKVWQPPSQYVNRAPAMMRIDRLMQDVRTRTVTAPELQVLLCEM